MVGGLFAKIVELRSRLIIQPYVCLSLFSLVTKRNNT